MFVHCDAGTPSFFQDPKLSFEIPPPQALTSQTTSSPAIAWWIQLQQTLLPSDLVVLPPGPRNRTHDFVARGLTMQPEHIGFIHTQWQEFSSSAELLASAESTTEFLSVAKLGGVQPCEHREPEKLLEFDVASVGVHPALCNDSSQHGDTTNAAMHVQQRALVDTFSGEGVAILSGSAPYFIPSLIALKTLRHTGCALPVEIWMPDSEAPSPEEQNALHHQLAGLGAVLQILPVTSGWHPQVLCAVSYNAES